MCVACSRSPSTQCTRIMLGPDYTEEPARLIVLYLRSRQSPVQPNQTASYSDRLSLRISPIRSAPSCYLCRFVFLVLRTDHSSYLSFREPPAVPRICPVLHLFPALASITLSVDLRVHCVIHLMQDCFDHRSSAQLKLGKAAKGVAPIPSSETMCCAPVERCSAGQYLWQREKRRQESQRKDYIITDKTH